VGSPPHRFVDEQIRGPYRVWIHEHQFTEKARGTLCEDSVQYAPLGGALINKLLVERDIRKIFAYRSERLQKFFRELREDELSARNDGDVVTASDATHPAARS
jgi:ligand-binding SRPBCC domain-containing protein